MNDYAELTIGMPQPSPVKHVVPTDWHDGLLAGFARFESGKTYAFKAVAWDADYLKRLFVLREVSATLVGQFERLVDESSVSNKLADCSQSGVHQSSTWTDSELDLEQQILATAGDYEIILLGTSLLGQIELLYFDQTTKYLFDTALQFKTDSGVLMVDDFSNFKLRAEKNQRERRA
jgi:hypothetical protein